MKGFSIEGKTVKEFNKKRWEKTGHDLDFIFIKDGIPYGCEIKNKLGYIEKEELEIKLEMCEFFKVRPLFIMRYSPKSYNKMIIDQGGFALIYKAQLYELSQVNLVKKIKERIGLPVDCPKSIPEGIIKRFVNWHQKQKV